MTEKTKKALAPDGWDEQAAIDAGNYFTDWQGVKHGVRTASDDGMAAANPPAADEIEAEQALDAANKKYEAALAELQEGMRQQGGSVAIDMNTGKGFMMFQKRRAAPATIAELRAAFREAGEDTQRARVKLSQAQERRADRIRRWYADQIVDTPLAAAIADAQRNGQELTEEAARGLAKPPVMVSPGRRSAS
jgi:hypothetical protein